MNPVLEDLLAGVYVADLRRGTLRLTDKEYNAFSLGLDGSLPVVQLAGDGKEEEKGGIVANAVIQKPRPPRLFLLRPDGGALSPRA